MKATVTTLKKRRVAILAGIGVALAICLVILCGLLASCSSQTDARSANARDGVISVMDEDESLIGDVQDGVGVSESEESASVDAEENPAEAAVAPSQSVQSSDSNTPSDANGSSPSSSAATKTQAPASSAQSAPQKKWVEDTQRVWVEDRAAWSESVPVYGSKEVSICNVCGADITGNTAAHGKAHMLAGEGSGHHSEVRKVVTGYNIVSHPAEGHYETKVVGGHWE